jgi:hypothetical protein
LTDEDVSFSDDKLHFGERAVALRTDVPDSWRVD